ncbi:hypothetical protein EUGRSUZ_B02320 [Eucalyptus grandis]|uniref:Uncharacterized protein n=2 Tax=Eucalyptus grandis TaxID=71139 RepID=A0ACC3LTB5_EUCGR|nr:hypothetical protein EUGRSUZ_B02320 [Eucalyptus grandis]
MDLVDDAEEVSRPRRAAHRVRRCRRNSPGIDRAQKVASAPLKRRTTRVSMGVGFGIIIRISFLFFFLLWLEETQRKIFGQARM